MAVVERVILFVVDGMRPDAMLAAKAPTMRRLMENGAYTMEARTVMPSITLPTHLAMFYSTPPDVHGVHSNLFRDFPDGSPPGITEVVRSAGKRAAFYHSWEPLRDLSRPGALAESRFVDIYSHPLNQVDMMVGQMAADGIVTTRPNFAFVYLGVPDEVAHKHRWMSPEYLESIAWADAALGYVLERLEAVGMLDTTACLLTADHGGHEHRHGSDCAEDMTIPWILAGAGTRRGVKLQTPVSILDTAPTIATLLGLDIPTGWQGNVVREALE